MQHYKHNKKIKYYAVIVIFFLIGLIFVNLLYKKDKMHVHDNVSPFTGDTIVISEPEEKDNIIRKIFNHEIDLPDEEIPLAGSSYFAKDIGMVPNDKSKAMHNSNKLINMLNSRSKIIIDDIYYITTPTEPLVTDEIEITGTDGAELISDNDSSIRLLKPNRLRKLVIANLKFKNLKSDKDNAFLVVSIGKDTNINVQEVEVRDCTFQGNISLYRQYGNTTLDPEYAGYGIDKLLFINNEVYETRFSFIVLFDLPVKYCEISNNKISNFMYTFLKVLIDNNNPFSNKLYAANEKLVVENNKVICDDNWWGYTDEVYYTFVLFEGKEVLYNNNYVEGIKAQNNIAIYDAYLSAEIVNYTNNTWKNNICFASDKSNNTLLKSKSGSSDHLVRNYSGNVFIVEEEFAERLRQPKNNLYVDFISLTKHADVYRIENNTFDVYDLRFPVSSLSISEFLFINNVIKAKNASGFLTILRIAEDSIIETIDVYSNIIKIDNKSDKAFGLIKLVTNGLNGAVSNIKVDNNTITAPLGYIFYDVVSEKMSFTNNKINVVDGEYPGFAYRGKFNLTEISNNIIDSKDAITFYEGRQLYGAGVKKESIELMRKNYSSNNNGMHLDVDYNSDTPTTYKRSYSFNTADGLHEFYYTFTLSYNAIDKCAIVTFTNNKGETKSYKLGGSDTSSNGNGEYIEVISQNGDNILDIPYKVRFFNNKESAGFYITEYSSNYAELKIETVSYESFDQSIS